MQAALLQQLSHLILLAAIVICISREAWGLGSSPLTMSCQTRFGRSGAVRLAGGSGGQVVPRAGRLAAQAAAIWMPASAVQVSLGSMWNPASGQV